VIYILEVLLDSSIELIKLKVFLNQASIIILKSMAFEYNRQRLLICILWEFNSSTDITEDNQLEIKVILPVTVLPPLNIDLYDI
jgi:hypothetical protein